MINCIYANLYYWSWPVGAHESYIPRSKYLHDPRKSKILEDLDPGFVWTLDQIDREGLSTLADGLGKWRVHELEHQPMVSSVHYYSYICS